MIDALLRQEECDHQQLENQPDAGETILEIPAVVTRPGLIRPSSPSAVYR
jgi:hypothetical protein